ncbi:tetratricopeptide repeat protein [Desulfocurvus sp. DL9XJH121]
MKVHASLLTDHGPRLTRSDLLTYEHLLGDEIASFLPHSSYSLYFPKTLDNGVLAELGQGRAVCLPEERKVLLPLALNGDLLGVFVARGARVTAPKTMPPLLAAMARMCVEKLQLYKISVTDPLSGLGTADLLSRAMAREIERIGQSLRPDTEPRLGPGDPGFSACFGLVLARLTDLEPCAEKYGPAFAARAVTRAAELVRGAAPEQALCARAGDDALAVLLPGATPAACAQAAEALAGALAGLQVEDPILEGMVRPGCSVGSVAYPQDADGPTLRRTAGEQAALVLRKAARAARAGDGINGRAFAFSRIVAEGGGVLEALPLGRVRIDLGTSVGAREGQRFLAWSPGTDADAPPSCKGEIALIQTGRGRSLAEITHQTDPTWPIAKGDRLTLVRDTDPAPKVEANGDNGADALTGLLGYRGFLKHLAAERDSWDNFCLVLMRLEDGEGGSARGTETRLRELASACKGVFGDGAVGGRMSLGGLAWALPGMTGKKARDICLRMVQTLPDDFPAPAVGVAHFPWLGFTRSQALDNAHKALEYARLLPAPHVGLLDSVALNIHADRLFAQGRLFDAMEEYKLALVADKRNTTARNSLGVCHARCGDLGAAKRQFKTVLAHEPGDVFALYNFGYACQRLGQTGEAREAYKKCLAADPAHVFSLIRLGQLSQGNRRFADAKRWFEKAATLPGGEGLTRRYLANLALARGEAEEAREHLHQALIHDPRDAASLSLMARIYLDGDEDPEVAEVLARQAAALAPEHAPFWKLLARALTARGKEDEAAAVLERAESL